MNSMDHDKAVERCCICGRILPNRFALAGSCEEQDCNKPFCSLHWHRSNHRCREHGYKAVEQQAKAGNQQPETTSDGEIVMSTEESKPNASRVKKAMSETLGLVKAMGSGALDLLKKLKKDKSPEAMLRTLEDSLAANHERQELVSARLESQYANIVAKKKAYASAPKARQRILEAELTSLLSTYKTSERELKILLENKRVLAQTKGRMQEVLAYDMAGVTEEQIDDVIDEVEESVDAAEARLDAVRDLEKAGKRKERASEKESLWDELSEFDEASPSPIMKELEAFEEQDAAESAKNPEAPEKEI